MQVQGLLAKRPRVELLPLIDMFFILLAFFIFGVFSMTMRQGIHVDLPDAASGVTSRDEAVTISLSAAGALFLNQEPVSLAALRQGLRTAPADAHVVINADRAVAHGSVIGVLDAVRQAGLQRVSFQTDPLGDGASE